jgi:hypothetical protein
MEELFIIDIIVQLMISVLKVNYLPLTGGNLLNKILSLFRVLDEIVGAYTDK